MAGWSQGIGRGLQTFAQLLPALTARRDEKARQERLDERQASMDAAALRHQQIQTELAGRQENRLGAADERAARGEEKEAILQLLSNLGGPTAVDDDTTKRITDAGFGSFLEDETSMEQNGVPTNEALPTGRRLARPFVTPAMKAANEATERRMAEIVAQNQRAQESLALRERELENRGRYQAEALDLRRMLAEATAARGEGALELRQRELRRSYETLVEQELKSRFPLTKLEEITGVISPQTLKARDDYKRQRMAELGFDGQSAEAPASGAAAVSTAPAVDKAAAATAAVRGR